ncbi:MAG: hypothetical protein Q8O56_17135 [Solirubrobacteraceae bacterium]|nr:hypothetical protein [Solirubrobacteraceae bacterium]
MLFVTAPNARAAADLRATELFRALDVVKRGAALVSGDTRASDLLSVKGPLSIRYALEHFYPRLSRLAARA